jgi:predicted ATP-dependent endonuclease of OLD family
LLAEQGNDVVVTTHDPAFVNLAQSPTVARVAKHDGRSVVYRSEDPLDFSYERVATKIRRGGNAEVLFAARAVLCEGPSDLAVIRALLDASGLDPDSLNISVIECGGRDQIPDYVRLLDALHIPLLVVSDGDAGKAEADEQTRRKVERLAEVAGDRHFVFTEDIETALGCEKRADNAQHLLSMTANLNLPSLPAEHEIAKLVVALKGFCAPQSASR